MLSIQKVFPEGKARNYIQSAVRLIRHQKLQIADGGLSDGDSKCLPAAPSVNITLVANMTKSVSTCDALGVRITGGKKPYNITFAAPNSPVLTNVTMGPTDDVFTYIDRADPNSGLLGTCISNCCVRIVLLMLILISVAVNDADGVWGTGSELFSTTGAVVTNQSCIGLVSSSGNSSFVNQNPKPPAKSHTTTIIVAVIVPIIVILLLAAAAVIFWRRRRQAALREPEPAFLPEAWQGPSTYDDSSTAYSPYDPPVNSKLARYQDDISHGRSGSSSQIGMSRLSPNRRTSDGFSTTASGSGSGPVPTRSSSTSKGPRMMPNRRTTSNEVSSGSRLPPGVSPEWGIEPDIIIQHRDGGTVQEIPPPYIDAAAGSSFNVASGSGGNNASRT